MNKYLHLLQRFFSMSIMQQIAYRPSFITAIIGKVGRIGLTIFVYYGIFLHTDAIQEWQFEDILLLTALYFTIEFLVSITFHRNLFYYLPDLIRKGQFDAMLTKPINTLFYSSFRMIDAFDLLASIPVIFLWAYVIRIDGIGLSVVHIPLIVLFVLIALVFIFGLTILISSFSFRTVQGSGAGRLFEQILRVSRFPTNIYHQSFTVFFSVVFPLAVIATLPVQIIQFNVHPMIIVGALLAVSVTCVLGIVVWNRNLRRYSSASS